MSVQKKPSNSGILFNGKTLKAIPDKKRTVKKTKPDNIIIETETRKDFRTIVDFILRDFKGEKVSSMPTNLKPMLASAVEDPFNDPNWQFEIKWDGYRALSYLRNGTATICSRNNNSFNRKFFPVYEALRQWPVNAVVDGEIVVLDEEGKPDFGGLQQWSRTGEGHLFYYLFDLLWLDGIDLTGKPLHQRKEILKKIVPDGGLIRFSDSIDEYGKQFFEAAKSGNLEGIMAKRADSIYQTGYRTANWCKIKVEEKHEAIICGYTKNANTDRLFSSLVLGIPTKKGIAFIGQVGTGFTAGAQKDIFKKINPLFTSECPFSNKPNTGAPTMWVKPHFICEVKYTERTKDGLMRHPSFQGLREDKTVEDFNQSEA
jgi:bifunctional non-homologous end joining protein LigD